MSENMKIALFTLLGVFVTAFVSWLTSFLTNRYNYRHLFAETVSQSRNKWLNEMRNFISVMLAEAIKCKDKHKTKEYYQARNEVLLRLNITEPLHLMLQIEIGKLDNCHESDYDNIEHNILEISRQLLKKEWDRVRKEAEGKEENK